MATSPASAGSLPEPLADPLRALRTGLFWLNGITVLLAVGFAAWASRQSREIAESTTSSLVSTLLGVVYVQCASGLLPKRPTDILYLRSFRTDGLTGGIRTSLERALPRLRVSGIRDPKRRWPLFLRFVSYLLFALKYANPKYLNLEAGDEWRGRLWRSLGDARGVVIDIADLTRAVEAEIRLCAKCVGLNRILFVIRDTSPSDWWQSRILAVLDGVGQADQIRVLNWATDGSSTPAFEAAVAEFGRQLPSQPAGFDPSARHLAEQLPGELFQESNRSLAFEITVTFVVVSVGAGCITAWVPGIILLVPAVLMGLVWWAKLLGVYRELLRDSGSRFRRCLATSLLIGAFVVPVIGVMVGAMPAINRVRDSAARMRANNQLKQLALAMQNYENVHGQLPAANARRRGEPKEHAVSWRVLVLPYVEQDDLYKQYRFDEPWDGPNNSRLLDRMPAVYKHPKSAWNQPAGHTHYRVFGSPQGVYPSVPFTNGGGGPSVRSFTDGPSYTMLIVEAEEAVPWTKPEVLLYSPDRPVPKLGGHFSGGFQAVMADGSVRLMFHSMSENELRAAITPSGGEIPFREW